MVQDSIYHIVVEENEPNGNKVTLARSFVMLPNQQQAVQLAVAPNVAHSGDTINLTASVAGTPADGQSKIKIYTATGELVRTLSVVGGMAQWDLRNSSQQSVASGVYIIVFDGISPTTGEQGRKLAKVMVVH